jgi:hypothetical protein
MSPWDYPDGLAGSAVIPVPTHSVLQKIAQSGQMNVTIYAVEGIVQQIVLEDLANFPDYTLPALLKRYGPPVEVLISTTNRPGSTVIPFYLILFYPQHGLMATYLDLTEVKDNSLRGCFHYTPGPILNFWPVQDTTFASIYEKLTTGSAEEFRPLQEVTTLDIPRFTELLKDSDYPCVESPAKYWPFRSG